MSQTNEECNSLKPCEGETSPKPEETAAPLRSKRIAAKKKLQEEDAVKSNSKIARVDNNGRDSTEQADLIRLWSVKEEEQFLAAIQKHGTRNPALLAAEMGSRNEDQIRFRLGKLKLSQKYFLPANKTFHDVHTLVVPPPEKRTPILRPMNNAIETWLSLLDSSHLMNASSSLAEAGSKSVQFMIEMISKYENHPLPEEAEGVNYALVYETLSTLMMGEVPKELDRPTSKKILDILGKLLNCVQMKENVERTKDQRRILESFRFQHINQLKNNVDPSSLNHVNVLQLPSSFFEVDVLDEEKSE